MDKTEYNLAKAEIISRLGAPVWDMREPINESARKLLALQHEYSNIVRQSRVDAVKGSLNEERLKKAETIRLRGIELSDSDLAPFQGKEKDILIAWFENKNQTNKQLAGRFGVTYQFVASLLRDRRVLQLDAKYFQQVLT